MSFNATAKAISRDKFSADRGSHRCCRTFFGGWGEVVNLPVIRADRVHVLGQDVADMSQEFLHAVLLNKYHNNEHVQGEKNKCFTCTYVSTAQLSAFGQLIPQIIG